MMKLTVNTFSIAFAVISLIFIMILTSYLTSINPFSILYNLFEKQKEYWSQASHFSIVTFLDHIGIIRCIIQPGRSRPGVFYIAPQKS